MKKVLEYDGFESAYDIERDMSEFYSHPEFKRLPPEFEGIIKITIEYIEPKTETLEVVK